MEVKFELPQVVNEALKPLASSIGKTLSYGWNGIFMGVETWYGKKCIQRDENLLKFKSAIQEEVSKVDENNIQEPQMNILGPALESSKYYFEEEWYREMFSKLIAASCDKSKINKIHPSFIEIIKQMDSTDAKILKSFKGKPLQPIANYCFKNASVIPFYKMAYFSIDTKDSSDEERHINTSSIINLDRLSLISISFNIYLTDDKAYEIFEKDKVFNYPSLLPEPVAKLMGTPYLERGVVELTNYGDNFLNICT